MIRTTFDVFGNYLHGKLASKVNPKSVASVVFHGRNFDECKVKMSNQSDGAFYKVSNVEKWNDDAKLWVKS
jgi:hypothetical protein